MSFGIIALVVVFQPELSRALADALTQPAP